MRKPLWILVFVWVALSALAFVSLAQAADVTLEWNAVSGATGYKIYRTVDAGTTWTMVQQVGVVTEYTLTGQPDSGMVHYRIGALNSVSETIRTWSGAWYNKDWQPPAEPTGTGIR